MKRLITLILVLLAGVILLSKHNTVTAVTSEKELLSAPWKLTGMNSASEQYQAVDPQSLSNARAVKVTYNLHGLCALGHDASALIFDQNGWKYVSLSKYGQNCFDGVQTVEIPITDFKDPNTGVPLDTTKELTGSLHSRFWSANNFTVDITSVKVVYHTTVTQTPTTTSFQGVTSGQTVSGTIFVSYNANSSTTRRVQFYLDSSYVNADDTAPFYLGGDSYGSPKGFDTKTLTNGRHRLKAVVRGRGGRIVHQEYIDLMVQNSEASSQPQATPSPTPTPSATPTPTPTPRPTPSATPTPTSTPTPTPTPTPAPDKTTTSSWSIQSVDAMKDTKDAICGQRPRTWVEKFADKAVEVGANYVAISQPYDNPSCGSALDSSKLWVSVIRSRGLKVWHRHMPLAFEGIYNVPKSTTGDMYLGMIRDYIIKNAADFENGDIFTPIPEPQNGGIAGITYCASGVCQFSSKEHFNAWLRDAITVSKDAFRSIGKPDVKVGYYGFDGFVAWGANNPDWNGILEDATVSAMGNITIDHYPELIGTDMNKDILELEARYPGVDIIIGEWGTVTGGNTEQTAINFMNAVKRPSVKGFNYWQFGPHGAGEQLINDDFTNRAQFDEVQSFFKGLR